MQLRMLLVLNILDLIMTMYGLEAGYIIEVNPVMAVLYNVSPFLFAGVKLAVVFAALIVIKHGLALSKRKKLLQSLLNIPVVIYSAVVIMNIYYYIIVST